MKRGKTMLIIIISILGVIFLITWGVITYLGRSQTLSVKSVENLNKDLYLIHLTKPDNMTWKSGSFAKIELADTKESQQNVSDTVSGATRNSKGKEQKSRWLTIASNPDEGEILILTHNSGSFYKKTLADLTAGTEVKMSWLDSGLSLADDKEVLVCFASDVGIAAIRPIIKESAGKREIILSHLDKGVTVFNEELMELANKTTNLIYKTDTDLSQSKETLKNAIDKYENKATYFLAGQPDDVKLMKTFLKDNGIDSKNIKSSSFRGLK